MNLASGIEAINFLLALIAAILSVGIFRRVSGRLATSWRYLLMAFPILALAEMFGAVEGGLRIFGMSRGLLITLLIEAGHLAFLVLSFIGLWFQFHLLKNLIGEEED